MQLSCQRPLELALDPLGLVESMCWIVNARLTRGCYRTELHIRRRRMRVNQLVGDVT